MRLKPAPLIVATVTIATTDCHGWADKTTPAALEKGLRTADIASAGTRTVGTAQMGDAIIAELQKAA